MVSGPTNLPDSRLLIPNQPALYSQLAAGLAPQLPVAISLILPGCPLLGVAAIRANDIAFVSARLVDYHDQQELPVPRSAGLEELIGRQQPRQKIHFQLAFISFGANLQCFLHPCLRHLACDAQVGLMGLHQKPLGLRFTSVDATDWQTRGASRSSIKARR
jgi:hypothetical protein